MKFGEIFEWSFRLMHEQGERDTSKRQMVLLLSEVKSGYMYYKMLNRYHNDKWHCLQN